MAKIKAPLFSLDASGTLDKTITYRNKPQNKTASKYAKPGDVNPFESSPRQKDQRSIIGLITACWQSKTNLDKLSWDASAKASRFKGSGYHYFLHLAKTDLKTYLGLVGFWSMNYSNGDSVPDLSGQNDHGTLMPIYPCDCPQPVDSINKKNGKAYSFNGTTNYILTNNLINSQDITIVALVKPTDVTPIARGIVTTGLTASYRPYILLQSGTTIIWRYGGGSYPLSVPNALTINKWALICVTRVALTPTTYMLSIYIDSILRFSHSSGVAIQPANSPTFIGVSGWTPPEKYIGIMDNVLIYLRELQLPEIQRLSSLFI